jgi:hypothetical protein
LRHSPSRSSPTSFQSLLLEVYARLARKVTPARLLEQYERDRFVRLASIDPRVALELDQVAFSVLPPGFEPADLGPLCSVVGAVGENRVVSTSHMQEAVPHIPRAKPALRDAEARSSLSANGEARDDRVL